jgi:hypothetical protein
MEMKMVMHRGTRFSILALGLALVMAPFAQAEVTETTAGLPGDWLADYQGARAVGLGGAYVAAADGPLGSTWNPAGLSNMFQNQVMFETTRLFEDTSINAIGFGFPGNRFPSFGFTALSLSSGAFERTSVLNEPLGEFESSDTAFLFSMAKSFGPQLSLGTNLKVVNQNVEEFSATGVGADLGMQYRVNKHIALGASLLNVGGPTMQLREADESYLTEIRGGFSLFLMDGKARLNGELDRRAGLKPTFHAGTEFWLVRSFALRVGFESTGAAGGFSYRMPNGFALDYGTADHELGLTHRVALSYNFGGFFGDRRVAHGHHERLRRDRPQLRRQGRSPPACAVGRQGCQWASAARRHLPLPDLCPGYRRPRCPQPRVHGRDPHEWSEWIGAHLRRFAIGRPA